MASFHSKIMLFLMAFALAGSSLYGCGDAKVSTTVDQSRNADDATAPRLDDKYFMVAGGETHLIGNVTETIPLKVFLYDKVTGAPAPNQIVSYEILEPTAGDEVASLSSYHGTTHEEGSASIDLRLGAQP